MKKILIQGNSTLDGSVKIHGAKNAVLPILSASILAEDDCVIRNCPKLSDVFNTINILKFIGHNVDFNDNVLTVYKNNSFNGVVPDSMIRKMRSSVLFMGALLNKYGYVKITLPGGCELGARPIDLHLKAFEQLGVKIKEHYGYYECYCNEVKGTDIYLDFPSVGATENIMI
ncbi:MAG: UDP-N-acetylglucosamine 1-carboxyvinyltransferase, partial [Clostridia bacterium]|nr:UDP-N-acetylglucosamine 1-carboxyvinyltransferase [Clostridia bacterium]